MIKRIAALGLLSVIVFSGCAQPKQIRSAPVQTIQIKSVDAKYQQTIDLLHQWENADGGYQDFADIYHPDLYTTFYYIQYQNIVHDTQAENNVCTESFDFLPYPGNPVFFEDLWMYLYLTRNLSELRADITSLIHEEVDLNKISQGLSSTALSDMHLNQIFYAADICMQMEIPLLPSTQDAISDAITKALKDALNLGGEAALSALHCVIKLQNECELDFSLLEHVTIAYLNETEDVVQETMGNGHLPLSSLDDYIEVMEYYHLARKISDEAITQYLTTCSVEQGGFKFFATTPADPNPLPIYLASKISDRLHLTLDLSATSELVRKSLRRDGTYAMGPIVQSSFYPTYLAYSTLQYLNALDTESAARYIASDDMHPAMEVLLYQFSDLDINMDDITQALQFYIDADERSDMLTRFTYLEWLHQCLRLSGMQFDRSIKNELITRLESAVSNTPDLRKYLMLLSLSELKSTEDWSADLEADFQAELEKDMLNLEIISFFAYICEQNEQARERVFNNADLLAALRKYVDAARNSDGSYRATDEDNSVVWMGSVRAGIRTEAFLSVMGS